MKSKSQNLTKIKYRWVVWILAIIAQAVPWYLQSVWAVVGIPIQAEMNISNSQYGILGSILMLAPAILSIPMGNLNKKFGSKPLVSIGLIVIAAGTYVMTLANSFIAIFFCRVLQGVGFAFIWTPAQTMCSRWFTRDELSTATGGNTVGLGLGGIIALVSTNLVDKMGWRTYLTAASIVILAVFVLVLVLVSSNPEKRGYPNVADIEKNLGIYERVTVQTSSVSSGKHESIWTWKYFSCYCLWFLCMGLYTAFTSWTTKVFELKGWSSATGGYITALSLAFGVVALLAGGPIADKLKHRNIQVRICALILAITYALVGFAPNPAIATVSAVIAGTIAYYWNAPYIGLLGSMAPPEKFEVVIGTNNCFAAAGAVVVPYLMGLFTGDGSMKSLYIAFTVLLVLGLVMFGLGFFMKEVDQKNK